MAKNKLNEHKWFHSASSPIRDIAHMLLDLDERGLIPDDMRSAIHNHAMNAVEVIPQNVSAISHAIAAAHSDFGLDDEHAAHCAWGVAALSDTLSGMVALERGFGEAAPCTLRVVQAA